MRILFIARHGNGGNDEEGAVTHALEVLGHEVACVQETDAHRAWGRPADLCLFFKFNDPHTLARLRERMRVVGWYFDLVDWPSDPTLKGRCEARKMWMHRTVPNADLLFCTDGDWVRKWRESYANTPEGDKLHVLRQAADSRHARMYAPLQRVPRILFTGLGSGGGTERFSFVRWLRQTCGRHLNHISHGLHGERLGGVIAGSECVVAPDSPVTHSYFSNRLYLTLGFGGFLLHPYCREAAYDYEGGKELSFYFSRDHLKDQISYYQALPQKRLEMAAAGHEATLKKHTYVHRVQALLDTVREKLGVS